MRVLKAVDKTNTSVLKLLNEIINNHVKYFQRGKKTPKRSNYQQKMKVFYLKGLPWHKLKTQVQRRSLGQKCFTKFGLHTQTHDKLLGRFQD